MTPVTPASEDLSGLDPAFQKAIDSHGNALDLPLPTFRADRSDWDRLQEKFNEWFSDLFKNMVSSKPGAGTQWFFENFFNILYVIAIIALIAFVVWLVHALRPRSRKKTSIVAGVAAGPQFVEPIKKLSKEIEEALAAGRISEAARLRWKLFLLRSDHRPSATPQEFASGVLQGVRDPSSIDWATFLPKHYELMFQEDRAQRETYKWVEERLARLEAARAAERPA